MGELLPAIRTEVEEFLDSDREDIYRVMSRAAVVHTAEVDIEIEQTKLLTPEDVEKVSADGPASVATPDWFNDVEWLEHPRKDRFNPRWLRLDATYPLSFFETKPRSGTLSGDRWLDQYGCIFGYGSGSGGQTNVWTPSFVAPGSRDVTRLRFPDDPTAMDQYNARYKQYLEALDESHPTLSYYRALERHVSPEEEKHALVIGGMSLLGFGLHKVVEIGSSEIQEDGLVRIVLNHRPVLKDGYIGRDIVIGSDDRATTEPYWDGEDDIQEASDGLLDTALKLIRGAVKAR